MRTKVVFALAAGCSITAGSIACGVKAPAEDVRTVQGSMSIAVRERLPGAWVVAQDDRGRIYLGRLRTDNSFSLQLPTERSYRLVVANGGTSDRGSAATNGAGGTAPAAGVTGDQATNTGTAAQVGGATGTNPSTGTNPTTGTKVPTDTGSAFGGPRGMTHDGTAPAIAQVLWPNGDRWSKIGPSDSPVELGTIGPDNNGLLGDSTLDRYGSEPSGGAIGSSSGNNPAGSSGEIPTYPGTGDQNNPNGTSSSGGSSGTSGSIGSSGGSSSGASSGTSGAIGSSGGSSGATNANTGKYPGDGVGQNPYTPGGGEKAKFRVPSRICVPDDQGTWSSTAKPSPSVSSVVAPKNEAKLAISCNAVANSAGDKPGDGVGSANDDQPGDGYGDQYGPPMASQPTQPMCDFDERAVQDPATRFWDCVKMETPVTYFYSDRPMKVHASVEFPRGILTQWYPAVRESYPSTKLLSFARSTEAKRNARVCDVSPSLETTTGLLDWGNIDVLGREANVDREIPQASLENFTWSFARQVAANPVRGENGQLEKFLFYRGIGNFVLPVTVTAQAEGRLTMKNAIGDAVPAVFVLNVEGNRGTYVAHRNGIAPNANLAANVPSMKDAMPIEEYADALARDVRSALDAQGLFDDEATAMVNTWKRQWFRTPGIRVLYLAPQSWTDRSLPLAIEPKPESAVRVMVMRVEVITPELERADVAAVKKLASPATAPEAVAHFDGLGRFAEPRLRRASWIAGKPEYATPLLATVIATNKTRHDPTAGTTPLTPDPKGNAYRGTGFVVHEWGTDTIVVGSDGSQQLGLQHEEEDLPKFVYDRRKEH